MTTPSPARPPFQVILSAGQFVVALLGFLMVAFTGYATLVSRIAVTEVHAALVPAMKQMVDYHEQRLKALEDGVARGRSERLEFQRDMIQRLDRIAESLNRRPAP